MRDIDLLEPKSSQGGSLVSRGLPSNYFPDYCCCSVINSCPDLCDPMNCSTPGSPVHHQRLELAQTHIHRVSEAIQPSHSVIPFSSCLQSFPASGSSPVSQLFTSGDQSTGASASASVLLRNIQGWFPLGLSGLIFLLSKGLSRVFSNTTVKNINFSTFSLPYGLTLTSIHDYWKNQSFDSMELC